MQEQKKNQHSKPDKKQNQALKYSGLAFQLFAVIGIGSYAGYWLDGYFGNKIPYLLLVFVFLSTGAALYSVYKRLPKD
ncbi:MAG: AtpZ/AtpI family protein [Bacteroidota bacterium]